MPRLACLKLVALRSGFDHAIRAAARVRCPRGLPGPADRVAGDGQAAIAGLGQGEMSREQAEDEPRGSLQDQVGGRRVAEPGADLASGDLDYRGTATGAQLDREWRAIRVAVVQEQ